MRKYIFLNYNLFIVCLTLNFVLSVKRCICIVQYYIIIVISIIVISIIVLLFLILRVLFKYVSFNYKLQIPSACLAFKMNIKTIICKRGFN